MTTILLTTLVVTAGLMVLLWLVSLAARDASIVDIFWGPGFVVIAWVAFAVAGAGPARAWLVPALTSVWGLRLAAHIAHRNLGRGEDYRYRAMREKHGARFPLVSLATVFLLQAVLMWMVSLPLQAVQAPGAIGPLGWLDAAGVALWATGLLLEGTADWQLERFRRTASPGAVMDRGVWRYSRHPNYFGDAVVWWGFGLIGVAAGAWWAITGPLLMTVLLLKVSGVAMLESTIADRRPAYRDYIRRTSAFEPWPPRERP